MPGMPASRERYIEVSAAIAMEVWDVKLYSYKVVEFSRSLA